MDLNCVAFLFLVSIQTGLSIPGSRHEVLNLPKLTTQHSILRGEAWTSSNGVIKTSISSVTACVWVKSSDLKQTGTLFSYYTSERDLQLGLVAIRLDKQLNTELTEPSKKNTTQLPRNDTNYNLHLVIGKEISTKPVLLRIDDAIWHYVCMTWNTSGTWQVYMDGQLQDDGKFFQVGTRIPGYGRLFFGSTIKTDNSTDFAPFTGEMIGLSVWDTVLSPDMMVRVSRCNSYKGQKHPSWLFDYSKSTYDILRSSLLYNWKTMDIVTTWPAKFQPIKRMCAREVTVDCHYGHMIITVSTQRFKSRDLSQSNLHLKDHACTPTVRGQNRNRFVFDVTNLQSCGTERNVTDVEVIYTNHVSNFPGRYNIVFGNFLYKSEIRCYYPIDLTVSMKLVDPEIDDKLIFRTPMVHPKTNTKDIEASVSLFQDRSFSQTFKSFPELRPNDNLYVGILVENTTTQIPIDDVNVVLDQCWVTSDNLQRQIIGRNGCWSDDEVTILENGRRSQGRLKLSSNVFSLSASPTFLECSTHPCVGDSCTPSCGNNQPIPGFREGDAAISWEGKRRLSKRAVDEHSNDQHENSYHIRVGPIFVKDFHTSRNLSSLHEVGEDDRFKTNPVFIALVSVLSAVALLCLVLATALMRKKLLDSRRYDVTDLVKDSDDKRVCRMNDERFTSFVSHKVSTVSPSMTSSITSLSCLEPEDSPQAETAESPPLPARGFYILV